MPRKTSGPMNGVDVAICDIVAPSRVKVSPAYAHSRRRKEKGCNKPTTANSLAAASMYMKYTG